MTDFVLLTCLINASNAFCNSLGGTGIAIFLNFSAETLNMDPLVPVDWAENSALMDSELSTYFA